MKKFRTLFFMITFLLLEISKAGVLFKEAYKYKWTEKEIPVCWANGTRTIVNSCDFQYRYQSPVRLLNRKQPPIDLEKYQETIRNAAEEEFTIERTGFKLVGWERCPDDTNAVNQAKIVIQIEDDPSIATGLVEGSADHSSGCHRKFKDVLDSDDMVSFIRIHIPPNENPNYSLENSLRRISLHELMHSAGVHHEDHAGVKSQNREGIKVSKYDAISIMSYRMGDDLRFNRISDFPKSDTNYSGLSPGDVHSLRCLYVYNQETRNKICEASYEVKN